MYSISSWDRRDSVGYTECICQKDFLTRADREDISFSLVTVHIPVHSLDGTLYLTFDSIPDVIEVLLSKFQFAPERFWIMLDAKLVVGSSVSEVKTRR